MIQIIHNSNLLSIAIRTTLSLEKSSNQGNSRKKAKSCSRHINNNSNICSSSSILAQCHTKHKINNNQISVLILNFLDQADQLRGCSTANRSLRLSSTRISNINNKWLTQEEDSSRTYNSCI